MTVRGDLTDEAWDRLRPFLPASNGRCGRRRDHRQVIDGILCRVRTGVQWRDLPERFGPWETVYERHRLRVVGSRDMSWSEAQYEECLHGERRRYAWTMQHHGGLTPSDAWAAALDWYPYEPSDTPHRGLVFHDEAWHWAMLAIHGDRYPVERPELVEPPAEYLALD